MEKRALMQALKDAAIALWLAGIVWLVLATISQVARASSFTYTVRDGGRYVLETLTRRTPLDMDSVLEWRPDVGSTPAVAALAPMREVAR